MKSDNYNLEDRTFKFARDFAILYKKLYKSFGIQDYIRQLLRASSSVGAKYIEANESLGKKDFLFYSFKIKVDYLLLEFGYYLEFDHCCLIINIK
ncbi:MAG: four helix bundle protein [Patescibacteria group bacterium]|nr:four helix bundle protein [Patescibacteria group bacterium]